MSSLSDRRAAFREFAQHDGPKWINVLQESVPDSWKHTHCLYIDPGSFNNENERRLDVFFGNRPLPSETEEGGKLVYTQAVDGSVACQIYPFYTPSRRPHERGIVIAIYSSPRKLTFERVSGHFSKFLAYSRVSMIDGNPSVFDFMRIALLRSIGRPIIGGAAKRYDMQRLQGWFFNVGLSGLVIAAVTALLTWWSLSK